jgi:hypothetical protein
LQIRLFSNVFYEIKPQTKIFFSYFCLHLNLTLQKRYICRRSNIHHSGHLIICEGKVFHPSLLKICLFKWSLMIFSTLSKLFVNTYLFLTDFLYLILKVLRRRIRFSTFVSLFRYFQKQNTYCKKYSVIEYVLIPRKKNVS